MYNPPRNIKNICNTKDYYDIRGNSLRGDKLTRRIWYRDTGVRHAEQLLSLPVLFYTSLVFLHPFRRPGVTCSVSSGLLGGNRFLPFSVR